MKSVKLTRLLIVAITLLMVMSVFTLIPLSLASGGNAFAADSEADGSEADGSETAAPSLRLVLTCDVQELETLESDQSFTLTARLEGVASVEGGVYCVSVRITPLAADELEFVGFTPSRDSDKGVYLSELMKTSQHKEGKYVSMEASCDMRHAITEDIEVGSYKFKLKNDPLKPTALKFAYRAMVTKSLDYTSFPIEETTYELPIKGISLGALIGIAVGIVAAIVIVIAVILIVDYKKKKSAKKSQSAAESEVSGENNADLQKDDSVQEAAYGDNNASESDYNAATNDGYNDNAGDSDLQEDISMQEAAYSNGNVNDNIVESEVGDESTADLQENYSAQEVIYDNNNALGSDNNVVESEFNNNNAVYSDLQDDNTTQD